MSIILGAVTPTITSASVLKTAFMWFDANDWAGAQTVQSNRGTDSQYTIQPSSGVTQGSNANGNYWLFDVYGERLEVLVNGNRDIPNNDKLHLPGAFTFAVALRVDNATSSARVLDKSSSTFSAQGYSVRKNTTTANFDFWANSSATTDGTAEKEILNSAWSEPTTEEMWVMSMDTNGNYVQYENATSVASGQSTSVRNELVNINGNGIELTFMAWGESNASARATQGRIYGIAFWDRVLTSDEVSKVYSYYDPRLNP